MVAGSVRNLMSRGYALLALLSACSGKDAPPSEGAGGRAAGGSSTAGHGGEGGSSGAQAADASDRGGTSGGGAGATAGTGSGGAGGGTFPCPPSPDAATGALCLRFAPEPVVFGTDPELDGVGILRVQLVNRATGGVLVDQLVPEPPDAGPPSELPIGDLPILRYERLPAEVDVVAVFLDNAAAIGAIEPTWGTWLAGSVDDAEADDLRLTLPAGTATPITVPLTALRLVRVEVSIASGVPPLDDGQGPLLVSLWSGADTASARLTGQGALGCADLSSGAATVEAAVLGAGTHYVAAVLNDFNMPQDPFPGSLWAPSTRGTSLTLAETIDIPADAYVTTSSVELVRTEAVDLSSPPAPFSCP